MRVGSVGIKSRASGSAGFTIVELLVVMVVIGILAGILFPVVLKAKETARTSQCLSNLHQLGAGLTLYIDSYDARFPSAAPWGSPDYWHQTRYGSQRTIQELLKPYVRNGMNSTETDSQKHHLYRFRSSFVCPSDIGMSGNQIVYGCPVSKPIWRYAGCSYEYYASNQVDWQIYDPKKPDSKKPKIWTGLSPEVTTRTGYMRLGAPMAKIMFPSRKAVLGDMWYWHLGDKAPDFSSGEAALQGRLAYRNTLFADGHAARVTGERHEQARVQQLSPMWHTMYEIPEE